MKFIHFNYCCIFIFLIFLLKKSLFVWLCLILVLARGIFDLHCSSQTFSCSTRESNSWSFPDQESNPRTLHWLHGVLATGPPWKSRTVHFVTASGLGVTTVVTEKWG